MNIQEVVDFICKTPENTNPNVLKSVLENMEGSGGSTLYKHNINFSFGEGGSDVGTELFQGNLYVYNLDSNPITTKEKFLEVINDFGPVAATGKYYTIPEQFEEEDEHFLQLYIDNSRLIAKGLRTINQEPDTELGIYLIPNAILNHQIHTITDTVTEK